MGCGPEAHAKLNFMTEAEGFGAELSAFRRRVDELRSARSLPEGEHLPTLDAALFELHHAAEVLWPRYEQLAAAGRRSGNRDEAHEQQVLRAIFQRLPVAVVLLDRDGVVRRLNVSATQLFGMRAGYAAGRPLSGSLTHEGRGAFSTQVAAVARGEGARSLRVDLLHAPGAEDAPASSKQEAGMRLRVTLTSLRPPQEPRTGVLAVFQPAVNGAAAGPVITGVQPAESAAAAAPDLGEISRHTELLDLIDDLVSELLVAERKPDVIAARAAAVLHERFADWVVVDLHSENERLRRSVVLGPDGAARDALEEQDPSTAPLVTDAVVNGVSTLQSRPEEPEAFGTDSAGAAMLVRTEAGSLICVPLTRAAHTDDEPQPDGQDSGPGPGPRLTRGALTLFRTGGGRAFELAEAEAVGRMARHIALALGGCEL